jgi:osmotically inducible lipoprotein OsmB
MKPILRLAVAVTLGLAALSLAACGHMSPQSRDTAVGAAVGGVAGSVLTGGSSVGTIGGAVVGGVIGNENGKNR